MDSIRLVPPGQRDEDGETPPVPSRAGSGGPAALDVAIEPHADLRGGVYLGKLGKDLGLTRRMGCV